MGVSLPILAIPFILIALVALGLATVAWQRNRAPGSSSFTLMMLAVAVWLITAAISSAVSDHPQQVIWAKVGYLAIGWIGTLWLAFALEFTFPESRLAQRVGIGLGLIPALAMGLTLINAWPDLVWLQLDQPGGVDRTALIAAFGPAFRIYIVYSYLALMVGALILFRGMLLFPRIHRLQVIGLVAGMSLPWAANLAYLTGWPSSGLDLTPFGFALMGIIYAWTLFRLGLFDLTPLAHEVILNNIGDGYLVLDAQDRVVEINPLAGQLLGVSGAEALGQLADTVFAGWPALVDLLHALHRFEGDLPPPVELATRGDPPVFLEARLTRWYQRNRQFAGRVVILHDITRRRETEAHLRESERMYRLLVSNAPVGIVLTDREGIITFASPGVFQLFGVEEQANPIGNQIIDWLHPADRPLGVARVRKMVEEQAQLAPQEYRLLRVDGRMFWGEITTVPLVSDDGSTQGLLAIIRDISAGRNLQMELQRNLEQQTFINDLLQILYRPHDMMAALTQVLERTGLFMGASRVYLCQDSVDGQETALLLEWCSPAELPRAREGTLVRYAAIEPWRTWILDHGMVIMPRADSAPEGIGDFMTVWNTQSLAAFPVYGSEEHLFGFMGVDFCDHPYSFSDEDLERLWNVCQIVSGAVLRWQVESAEHRQRVLAEALHDTSSALNSTLNFEEVLDRILSNLSKVVQHDSASIAMVDEENNVFFVRWRGYDQAGEATMQKIRIPLGERETYRWMALTNEPVIITDTWLDKRWTLTAPYLWIRSYAGVPIHIKGKIVGFINLDSREPDRFSLELAYSLHVFADQAAVAIENARLYDAIHRRMDEMSTLNRIGMTLIAGLDMQQILINLFEQCSQVLPIDNFYVALFDPATGRIDLPLYYKDGQFETVPPRNIADEAGVTGEVIRQRRTIYLPDVDNPETEREYRVIHLGGRPARAYVGVPLILLDQVVGVISMQNLQPYAYKPEQVRLLETIATQAAIAVQNARLYEQMRQMAITDAVTGLFTRRHFTALGRSEVERALRYNRALSVMMVDIDRFKVVNDTHGHNVGDQVLKVVADVTRQVLRTTDIIGRWGGEEFVLVLPEADRDGAALIAERIRRMVSETEIPVSSGAIRVTISIGVATLGEQCCSLEVLIDCADQAMYLAKQNGRNQVRLLDI